MRVRVQFNIHVIILRELLHYLAHYIKREEYYVTIMYEILKIHSVEASPAAAYCWGAEEMMK